jgi:hypothetical protein
MACFAVYGAFQIVALGRYPESVNWSAPQAWLYAAFPLLLLVTSSLGWLSAHRARSGLQQ